MKHPFKGVPVTETRANMDKINTRRTTGVRSGIIMDVLLIVVLAVFLWAVYSRFEAKDVPMDSIQKAMEQNTDLSAMQPQDERDLYEFLSLDYTDYDSFLYYKNTEALQVDELLILKAKSADDLDAAMDAVESRIDSQEEAFEGYAPEQVAQLQDAVILTRGNYLFYCVAENPEDYEEVFLNVIQ